MLHTFSVQNIPVLYQDIEGCGLFGKRELETALKRQSIKYTVLNHWTQCDLHKTPILIVGKTTNRRIQMLLESEKIQYHLPQESIIRRWCEVNGGSALVIAGTDDTGLMYALLETAREILVKGITALNSAANLMESPTNAVRCVDRYLLGHLDNEWFLSEEFWHYLLQRMAKARFNRFCLILGFDTAYMSPPYPFFINIKAYSQVKARFLNDVEIEKNLSMLNIIGKLCHDYGIKFIFATWQQRPWTTEQDRLVDNLPEDEKELSNYCYEGLKELISVVPEIDIVQFRVNHESGVGTQISAEDFWNRCTDAVADVAIKTGRPLILDLRSKGLTDAMIAHAFERGLAVEVPTKYWCEHAALPHHITIMRSEELEQLSNYNHSRRYSYADMLKKPRYYDVIYRLWNYGSTNLFLWGDPDYARRFSLSCTFSNSAGFQINTPLSLKYGHELSHKEHWHTFRKPGLRYGKWEDERFWLWYILFGRLGYNPKTDASVWQDEFCIHFGKKRAAILEQALTTASKIIPFITTVHMPVHPSLRYWTEMNTGWALFVENNLNKPAHYDWQKDITYGSSEPSDHGLFYGIDEYVRDYKTGKFQGKYSPLQSAYWLDEMADYTEQYLKQSAATEGNDTAEYLALCVDLSMLCDFARYHANKIRAALALAFWNYTKKTVYLSDCAILLDQAISSWKLLAQKGSENYYHDLDFSSAGSLTRRGTWADFTCELEADRKTLSSMLANNKISEKVSLSETYKPVLLPLEQCRLEADFPKTAVSGEAFTISVRTPALQYTQKEPVLHYRHTDQTEGLFHKVTMKQNAGGYAAVIPANYLTNEWDLQIYITIQGKDGSCNMFPGIYHPVYPYPYHVITIIEKKELN